MFFKIKYHFIVYLLFSFFILIGCQLQEPLKSHGIIFLENRANKLILDTSNQNDVLKIIGQPHSRSIDGPNKWIYLERTLSKGKYHKLGKHVLKSNNILVLTFDKYGVLESKKFYSKDDINKITFSQNKTKNELAKKSFVESFLTSIREKMYRGK